MSKLGLFVITESFKFTQSNFV